MASVIQDKLPKEESNKTASKSSSQTVAPQYPNQNQVHEESKGVAARVPAYPSAYNSGYSQAPTSAYPSAQNPAYVGSQAYGVGPKPHSTSLPVTPAQPKTVSEVQEKENPTWSGKINNWTSKLLWGNKK